MSIEQPEAPLTPEQEEIGQLKEKIRALEQEKSDWLQEKDALEKKIVTDELTGLYNLRGLEQMAKVLLPRDEKKRWGAESIPSEKRRPITVAMFDLDDFKKFNSDHGHLKANEVLKSAADVLRGYVRENDVVARFGGEEFVAIFADTTGEDIKKAFLDETAGRLRVGLTTLIDGKEVRVSFSGGVTEVRPDENISHFPAIMERANRAMREAKATGKDRITHFEEEAPSD